MQPLLTTKEVAKILKVCPRTIKNWVNGGKISCILLPGGEYRFRPEWVDNWLNKKTIKPVKQVV